MLLSRLTGESTQAVGKNSVEEMSPVNDTFRQKTLGPPPGLPQPRPMPAERAMPSSRPPVARMFKIHGILANGRATNCTKLAQELEVSTKTIMRDLAFMRDQQGLPLEYDQTKHAWRYTEVVKSLPLVQVTEGELLAVLVAQKALTLYAGTPYHGLLTRAFEKLSAGLSDRVSFAAPGALQNVSFHHAGLGRADLKLFESLARSVNESREIEFTYRKPGAKPEQRRVQPYHLANRENAWYLVGHDLARGALRNYAVVRMSGIAVTTKSFVRPADFSPEKHFGKAFGAFVGTGDYKVLVRFSSKVASQVQERFWHESQETKVRRDGSVDFTVQLGGLDEILKWVLGWGEHAEVIAPAELRERIRTQAAATARRHVTRQ